MVGFTNNTPAVTQGSGIASGKRKSEPLPPDLSARFWRLGTVLVYTGRSKSTTLRDKTFPPAIHLGPNSVAWESASVKRWADERIAAATAAAEEAQQAALRRAERAREFSTGPIRQGARR